MEGKKWGRNIHHERESEGEEAVHAVVPFGSGSLRESGGNRRGFGLGER